MKQNITESYFIDQIVGDEYTSMTGEGARALFHYLEQLEDDCDFEIEFDRVAIRCEWNEYTTIAEALEQYDTINNAEELSDNTTIIYIPGTDRIILQEF